MMQRRSIRGLALVMLMGPPTACSPEDLVRDLMFPPNCDVGADCASNSCVDRRCAGGGECASDDQCADGTVCHPILGVCEAPADDNGAGDGEGGDCDSSAFDSPTGSGLVAYDLELEFREPDDGQDVVWCGRCFVDRETFCTGDIDCGGADDRCVGPGAVPYRLTFSLGLDGIDGDLPIDAVLWSKDGGEPTTCDREPNGFDGSTPVHSLVFCPVCLSEIPNQMAAQYADETAVSNAVCATFPD